MKKMPSSSKLRLTRSTVATLTPSDLIAAAGGMMAYTKQSVCADQCCKSDYCSGSAGC